MRKYKAFIIDLKTICKNAAVLTLTAAVAASGLYIASKTSFFNICSPEKIVTNNNPIIGAVETEPLNGAELMHKAFSTLSKIIIGYAAGDNESLLRASLPIYRAATCRGSVLIISQNDSASSSAAEGTDVSDTSDYTGEAQSDIPEDKRAPIKQIDASQRLSNGAVVAIGNETSYGIDINNMLSQKPDINIAGDGPKVLITHTHATEAYAMNGAAFYDKTASDRSENKAENVVRVGDELAAVLEEKGIKTVHDTILHDVPSFNGSYAHSLSTVNEYLKKYPSIQVVFDVHRDSIVYDDDTKAKTATQIDGKSTAQLMFVVGTDQKGLYNPDWRENMKAAIHFQSCITAKYPKLMRHINLRRERFNGHTTHASMIIEVGTSGNSLEEAVVGIRLAGGCIADYLNTL